MRLFLANGHVYFEEPGTGRAFEAKPSGQAAIEFLLERVDAEMRTAMKALRERKREELGKIDRRAYVQHGAWCVAGTRITTAAIWRMAKAGCDAELIIREFPSLTAVDVKAAIAFEERRRLKHAA